MGGPDMVLSKGIPSLSCLTEQNGVFRSQGLLLQTVTSQFHLAMFNGSTYMPNEREKHNSSTQGIV